MKVFVETDRILLREIVMEDAPSMFEMDSDKEVHKYLGNQPFQSITESEDNIRFIRQQYVTNGIGRWAVIDKKTNQFTGWGGLKLITTPTNGRINFYEVGYRFLQKFWGQGLATAASKAALKYAFEVLLTDHVYAMAEKGNEGSRKVLLKAGFDIKEEFEHNGITCDWFEISKAKWELLK